MAATEHSEMNIAGMDVYVRSDLKDYGYTEDGTPFIGELFFIEIANDRGDTWVHGRSFPGCIVVPGEEGPIYTDNRPNARAHAEALIAAIKQKGQIDLAHWSQGRAVYGSDAYMAYGQAEELAWERAQG
jgi:hypothetical protein